MNISEGIKSRRTVRGFKPKPVPNATLQTIFSTAQLAPSNCNTQPWHCAVFSGEARKELEQRLLTTITKNVEQTPFFRPGDSGLDGVYKDRQYACAYRYYDTMGIARDDREKRKQLSLKNWQFFGAPHVGILSMPKTMGEVNGLDVGIYLQTLMLLFVEHGIASCALGSAARYPAPIIEMGGVPEGNAVLCGIAFGYEDVGAQINDVKMPRSSLENAVTFID